MTRRTSRDLFVIENVALLLCLMRWFIMVLVWLGEVASSQHVKREVKQIFGLSIIHRTKQSLLVPEPLLFPDERGESQVTDKPCLHAVIDWRIFFDTITRVR